jgi:predicted transglutaminase-like cysteine proteinase
MKNLALAVALLTAGASGAMANNHFDRPIDSSVAQIEVAPRPSHGPAARQVADAQPVLGPSAVPIGWVGFCQERPGDCRAQGPANAVVELTAAREAELNRVNLQINHTLRPVADMVHYGVAQRWTIPTDGAGSCHHYMLLKRQALMRRGWPQSALLVTVVLDHQGQGHAILTVHTTRGDLILDNLTDQILPWDATGYQYLMRQSASSPNAFDSVGNSTFGSGAPAVTSSMPLFGTSVAVSLPMTYHHTWNPWNS